MFVFSIISLILACIWGLIYTITFVKSWWKRDGSGVGITLIGLIVAVFWILSSIFLMLRC